MGCKLRMNSQSKVEPLAREHICNFLNQSYSFWRTIFQKVYAFYLPRKFLYRVSQKNCLKFD